MQLQKKATSQRTLYKIIIKANIIFKAILEVFVLENWGWGAQIL